jgi:hypothetical protein
MEVGLGGRAEKRCSRYWNEMLGSLIWAASGTVDV